MIRFYRRAQDIEQGMPLNDNDAQQRRMPLRNRWLPGSNRLPSFLYRKAFFHVVVVLILFFVNYPLASLLMLLALLLCVTSCLRLIVQYSRQVLGDAGATDFWTQLNLFRLPPDINLANLRLTLLDRDFNENDYDMLLALDNHTPAATAERHLTRADMETLPLKIYQAVDGKEEICSVCLEVFKNEDRLRLLPCRHAFHESCIGAWLRQKGISTTCPICKKRVLASDR